MGQFEDDSPEGFERLHTGQDSTSLSKDVLDHGQIELIDVQGSDQLIEQAARVSYAGDKQERTTKETTNLLRYLMRHHHTTPFEMAGMIFRIKAPIFVARQWMRHRTASINEISGRYAKLPEEVFQPKQWRGQSSNNKQGSDGLVEHEPRTLCGHNSGFGDWAGDFDETAEQSAFLEYNNRLNSGVSRELARTCLPLGTYTEWYWKMDLHNLLHFLRLRLHPHAQEEIRVYAEAIAGWVEEHFPITWQAFVDYRLEAVTFSRHEAAVVGQFINGVEMADFPDGALSEREICELHAKLKSIGVSQEAE